MELQTSYQTGRSTPKPIDFLSINLFIVAEHDLMF